jgi:hypothetical protein
MFGLLGIFGCTDKKLEKIIIELHNTDKEIRGKAIDKLEKCKINRKQQIYLLNEATNDFPPAIYEWQTIPCLLVKAGTKTKNNEIVPIIKKNFENFDSNAKNEALNYLTKFDSEETINLFKELIIKYHTDFKYQVPTGTLNKKIKYSKIIFPEILTVISQDKTDFNILLLLLAYLNSNELDVKEFKEFSDTLIEISKKNRIIIKDLENSEIDIWDNDDFQDAKYKAGIVADLLGYFNTDNSIKELKEYISLKDSKLKMFAIRSLLKLGQEVDKKEIELVASNPETRNYIYDALLLMKKDDLIPEQYRTQSAFAESDMVNWLTYPTELGRAPDKIELMKVVEVDTKSNDGVVEFYIFRFMSNHENWKDEGWMVGLSGYFPKKDKPSTLSYGYTFSTFEKWDEIDKDEYVKEIMELINKIER